MNRKNKKRAFVTSIIMLIISAIVLTSSTFAWFVMGDKVEIEEMDVKLYAPEGIQISANANQNGWTQSLSVNNLFDTGDKDTSDPLLDAVAGNKNMYPEYLIPASSGFAGATNGYPNFFSAKVSADGTSSITQIVEDGTAEAAAKAGIVAFDIFIKSSSSADTKIDFSNSKIEEVVESGATPTNCQSAIRYAFVELGNDADATKDGSAYRAMQGSINAHGAEADSLSHSTAGIVAGATAGSVYSPQAKGVTAAGNDKVADTTKYIFTDGADVSSMIALSNATDSMSFMLKPGVTRFRVYIWAEGNDIDCREVIAGSSLKAQLMIEIPEA